MAAGNRLLSVFNHRKGMVMIIKRERETNGSSRCSLVARLIDPNSIASIHLTLGQSSNPSVNPSIPFLEFYFFHSRFFIRMFRILSPILNDSIPFL